MALTGIFKKNRLAFVISTLLLWSLILNLFCFTRFDVDSYHDGFIYPMALLSSQGKLPNLDYFSFYGPLGPILQGVWLKLVGQSLLSLRVHGALLIILVSYLMFKLCLRNVGKLWSLLISTVWLISHPLIVNPSLPWPDLYVTCIQLFALLFLSRDQFKVRSRDYFIFGLILSFTVLAKINAILPITFSIIILLYILGLKKSTSITLGFVSGILSFCLAMAISGSLSSYMQQTILYNLQRYDEGKSIRGIFNIKIGIYGIALTLVLILIRLASEKLILNQQKIVFMSIFLSVVMFAISWEFRQINVPFTALQLSLHDIVSNFLKNSPYWLLFGVLFLAIVSGTKIFSLKLKDENQDVERIFRTLGFTSLLLLYPNPEPAHIWYMAPTAIVAVVECNKHYVDLVKTQLIGFLILLPSCFGLIAINIQYLNMPRVDHKVNILDSMMSDKSVVNSLDKTLLNLQSYVGKRQMQNNCLLGLFAVPGNEYLVSDFQYVDLDKEFRVEKTKAQFIFECNLSDSEMEYLYKTKQVIFSDEGYYPYGRSILYRNNNGIP